MGIYRYISFLLMSAVCISDLSADQGLTLDACQRIALDKNPLARAACEGVRIAKETVGVSQAPYYPEVDLHAHYQRWQRHNFLTINDPTGLIPPGILPSIIGPTNDYDFSIHSRYLLFDWGKRHAHLMTSLAEQGAACQESERVRQEILLNVSVAFYSLFANLGLEHVATTNLERAKKHHQLTTEEHTVGAAPLADVYRAQVEVAEGKQQLVRAESMVRISRTNLKSAMGLPPDIEIEVKEHAVSESSPDEVDLKQAQHRSVQCRPELKIVKQQLCALQHRIKGEESEFGPRFNAIGGYGKRDSDWEPRSDEWRFGVSMELPLFTGFETTHRVRRAKAEFCKAKAEYHRLCINVQQDVWVAYSKMLEAYEMVQTSIAQVKDAKESMRLTEERYKAGSGIISDLLDAQTALARAEATHVDALWSYQSAQTVFIWTQGLLNL